MLKLGLRYPRFKSLAAYAAALVAVPVTTWGLSSLQTFLNHLDGQMPRPFGIAFLLVVAGISILGGSGPGLFALLLSAVCTIRFLIAPSRGWFLLRPTDAAEVFIELSVGLVLVMAIHLARRSRQHSLFLLEQAQNTQARLQTIMDVAPVGVILCDSSGYLNYANREAERLWGQPLEPGGPETWSRYGLRNADGKSRAPGETGLLRALKAHTEVVRDEVIITRPDASEVYAQASSAAILDGSEQLLGAVCAMIDVTERRLAETLSRELAEREGLLNRIGQAQRASDNPEQVQQVAVAELGLAMNADRCSFIAADVEQRRLRTTHEWRRENLPSVDLSQLLGEFASNLINPFLLLDETFAIDDVITNKWTRDFASPSLVTQARSLLLVPLFEQTVLVGVLVVAMADQPRVWTNSEISLLEAVAAQTRTSVNLALVLQRERNIAERLQEALKPTLPEGDVGLNLDYYYRPALAEANVGGDFFDIFIVEENCIALVVGDLSGKGLAAASQIATIRNMLRFALYQGNTLSDAICGLNEVLVQHSLLQGFATLFIGLYDTETGLLTYVSCGHETALVRRRDNVVEELDPTGTIIGAFAGAEFEQGAVTLLKGDALLMFTDGLSEAGRSRHDFLGVEGLVRLVKETPASSSATDYIKWIIDGVAAHNRGIIHDDQCLVAAVIR